MEQTNPLPDSPMLSEVPIKQPVSSSSPNKSILIILSVILLVVLSSLVTYLFVKSQTPSQKPTIPPAPLVQTSPTPDTTANWETYTDPGRIFEIKYPGNLNVTKARFLGIPGETKDPGDAGVLSSVIPWNAPLSENGIRIEFNIDNKKPTESLDAFFARINNRPL